MHVISIKCADQSTFWLCIQMHDAFQAVADWNEAAPERNRRHSLRITDIERIAAKHVPRGMLRIGGDARKRISPCIRCGVETPCPEFPNCMRANEKG